MTDPVLELFDRRITAADLASPPHLLPAGATVAAARRALRERGFDTTPVPSASGGLRRIDPDLLAAAADDAPVAACTVAIVAEARLEPGAPLPAVLEALRREPFLVVCGDGSEATARRADGSSVVGVITRRDLDRPVVGLAVLGLIVRCERHLDVLIDRAARHVGGWEALLPPERAAKLGGVRAYLRRPGYDLGPMSTLNLDDRLTLVAKLPALRAALGWPSRASFRRFAEPLRRMRDAIAHGGGVLRAVPDPLEALAVVFELRAFVDRVEALVVSGWEPVPAVPATELGEPLEP
ncbi:MAG: hypothetical protein R2749_09105 [Acidimicrobiales bacterium]